MEGHGGNMAGGCGALLETDHFRIAVVLVAEVLVAEVPAESDHMLADRIEADHTVADRTAAAVAVHTVAG